MKVWIALFAAALLGGGVCLGITVRPKLEPHACPAPAEKADIEFPVKRFTSELTLSADQNRQLDAVLGDTQRDVEAYHRAIRQAHEHSRERLKEFLTPPQKEKLEKLIAQEREKRTRADVDRYVQAYREILDLDRNQAAAVERALRDAGRRKFEYFQVGPPRGDFSHARGFLHTVREDQQRAIEKTLRPDQCRRFDALRKLEH